LCSTFVAYPEEGQRVEAVLPLVDELFQMADIGAVVHFWVSFYPYDAKEGILGLVMKKKRGNGIAFV
jgi:hypothetical protein